ncbi:MAG TPA: SLOG family protein [Marmoricola sp.]|jgi:hypothetical protein
MRILVTGSRNWLDRDLLNQTLDGIIDEFVTIDRQRFLTEGVTLVSGRCSSGADKMAEEWAAGIFFVDVEPHPADWDFYGKRAGFVRNTEMVDAGADVCAAFVMPCDKPTCPRKGEHGSHGATHCSDLAANRGIDTRRLNKVLV